MPLTEWNGDAIKARIVIAAAKAINEITEESAAEAEQDHWWTNRTENLERQTISQPAGPVPGGVVGMFGTTEVKGFYGLFLEYKQPFLRPIADRTFPTLGDRMAALLL